jgi:Ca2+-transporting ATPase
VVANICKFLPYVLASNVAEMAPFLAMVIAQIPAALNVLQILAVDLGTDLLPALGLGAEQPEPGLMGRPPRPRHAPLLDRPLMVRAYVVLGLTEALMAMAGYLAFWHQAGVSWPELRVLAPQLLQDQAPVELVLLQHQASSVAFGFIVFGQIGVAMACRSSGPSSLRLLLGRGWRSNGLLWFGVGFELLFLAVLVLVEPVAEVFAMAPFPLSWFGWMLVAPWVVLLVDDRFRPPWRA